MNPDKKQFRLDRLAAEYMAAIEENNFERQYQLWLLADHDPDLTAAYEQVHQDLLETDETEYLGEIARTVAETMPTAELPRPIGAAITAAEVAAELTREGVPGWTAAEHALNERVKSSEVPLPAELDRTSLYTWATANFGADSISLKPFWKKFAETAVRLTMLNESQYTLAARRTPPKKGGSS